MVLARQEGTGNVSTHPFWYARVLGVYHVNVVYTGPGMLDCESPRIDFLWVRWLCYIRDSGSWDDGGLDRLRFPALADSDSFGFVDPNDVLRGCHIIPCFAEGKLHRDGSGLSRCASDAQDWRSYYVNRCVAYFMLIASYHIHWDYLGFLIEIWS